MPGKMIEDYDFNELVDWAAGYILTELISGKYRSAVWYVLNVATQWHAAQDKKRTA